MSEIKLQGVREDNQYTLPKLVKLQKKKGQLVHSYDIYIGRRLNNPSWNLSDSIWANPFKITIDQCRDQVIKKYKEYLLNQPHLLEQLHTLSGKTLGCWCAPEKCHGDVIIELFKETLLTKTEIMSI